MNNFDEPVKKAETDAEILDALQGVKLTQDEIRLDRKKFARETWAEFEALFKAKPIRAELALIKAVGFMVGPEMHRVTPEEVGVLKLLKLAVEYDGFLNKLEAEGRETYTTGELVDEVVLPIIKL